MPYSKWLFWQRNGGSGSSVTQRRPDTGHRRNSGQEQHQQPRPKMSTPASLTNSAATRGRASSWQPASSMKSSLVKASITRPANSTITIRGGGSRSGGAMELGTDELIGLGQGQIGKLPLARLPPGDPQENSAQWHIKELNARLRDLRVRPHLYSGSVSRHSATASYPSLRMPVLDRFGRVVSSHNMQGIQEQGRYPVGAGIDVETMSIR